jgi:shikimate dehydrogenase
MEMKTPLWGLPVFKIKEYLKNYLMKRFLVIGNPIEHSLSPTLHNYWIKSNGIEAIYEKQKLDDSELRPLIEQLKKRKIDGVNVTCTIQKSYHTFFR